MVEIKGYLIEEFDRIHGTWSSYKFYLNIDTCWTDYNLILAENKTDKKYRVTLIPAENDT